MPSPGLWFHKNSTIKSNWVLGSTSLLTDDHTPLSGTVTEFSEAESALVKWAFTNRRVEHISRAYIDARSSRFILSYIIPSGYIRFTPAVSSLCMSACRYICRFVWPCFCATLMHISHLYVYPVYLYNCLYINNFCRKAKECFNIGPLYQHS